MANIPLNRISPKPSLLKTLSRHWINDAWQILAFPMLFLFILPILAIFFRISPADMISSLQQEQALDAIRISAISTLATVIITLLFGTWLAYLLYRRRSRISRFLDTIVDLPTVLPPAVAGLALLLAFGRRGMVGETLNAFGISIPFTIVAVILAQTFVAAPLYIKSAALGFASVNCDLKKAAALDGANRWQVFRHIMVPISWTSILSGIILTWARALGEFGATIIFAGNLPGRTQTMPLAIYIGFEVDLKVALTLSAILILFSFLVLIALKLFLHSRFDEIQNDEYDLS
jgi:molybdate transport system permease protein